MIVEAKPTLEKIQEYVLRNVVPVRIGRKCVDGRYLPTQATGMIARPGGDLGYVMALMAVSKRRKLGFTSEKCFDEVYKVVCKDKGHFYLHTDHHVDPDVNIQKSLIGCGHAAKAANENLAKGYGVESKDMANLVAYVRNIAHKTPNIEMIILHGDHGEKGVLVVHGEKYTVNAQNPATKEMYFVYDEERDTRFLNYLVGEMAIKGVDFAEMKRESDLQLGATLHNLAKGLPIFDVNFKGKTPSASFASFVE